MLGTGYLKVNLYPPQQRLEVLIMYLQKDTKKILEKFIGKSILELSEMDLEEEISFIKSKISETPVFSKNVDFRIQGRGNPLMTRKRICTMAEIDKKILEMR